MDENRFELLLSSSGALPVCRCARYLRLAFPDLPWHPPYSLIYRRIVLDGALPTRREGRTVVIDAEYLPLVPGLFWEDRNPDPIEPTTETMEAA
jgi:hypothetical protein